MLIRSPSGARVLGSWHLPVRCGGGAHALVVVLGYSRGKAQELAIHHQTARVLADHPR